MKFILMPKLVDGEQWFPNRQITGVMNGENIGEAKTIHGMLTVLARDWVIKYKDEIIDVCPPTKILEYYEVFNGDKDL